MDTVVQPPWGTDWKPAPPPLTSEPRGPGNPSWVPGGPSPNPSGRPAGIPDRRLLATQQMLDEMRNIVAVLIGKALEGDSNSAAILMAKCLPSIKAQAEKVNFDFDPTASISEQVAAVLDGVARGQLAPDVARLIIDGIKSLSDVRATEELSARIEALEAATDARR
jgi:hypothetical protein